MDADLDTLVTALYVQDEAAVDQAVSDLDVRHVVIPRKGIPGPPGNRSNTGEPSAEP